MSDIFQEALMLMAVGMTTVFAVLFLVVGTGNLLIRMINQYFPEPAPSVKSPVASAIAPAKIAAITAAVSALTGGRGQVEKIVGRRELGDGRRETASLTEVRSQRFFES